jgi:hypothetical protein
LTHRNTLQLNASRGKKKKEYSSKPILAPLPVMLHTSFTAAHVIGTGAFPEQRVVLLSQLLTETDEPPQND